MGAGRQTLWMKLVHHGIDAYFCESRKRLLDGLFAPIFTFANESTGTSGCVTSMSMRVLHQSSIAPVFMRVRRDQAGELRAVCGFQLSTTSLTPCTISGHGLVDELHLIDSR